MIKFRLNSSLLISLLIFIFFNVTAQSLQEYPWLDEVVSDNCCLNQTATAYDFGHYSFVYIKANENCAPSGKLYREDGRCWCEDKGDTFCLDFYKLTSRVGEIIFECEDAPNFTPFDQFDWLESAVNKENCDSNASISVYLRNGHYYTFVESQNGLGKLQYANGDVVCTSKSNYDCVALYGLTDETLMWTCGDGQSEEGVDIILRNTLQEQGEPEVTYASLFGAADDAFDEFATLSNTATEFPTALAQGNASTGLTFDISGLYNIDFTETGIDFTLLPDENDPFWIQQFGVFPEGKFDRYYFTFSEPHNITNSSSNNSSVNLIIESETVVVVEIGEGYDFNPGISFSISFQPASLVVEVTTFNLNAGVDANAFEIRDTEIERDFASQQPGFLKRMGGLDADGKYVVMVFWDTLEDADASIAAFGSDPTVADYFAMIDGNTFSAERFTTFDIPDISFNIAAKNVIEITTFNLNAGVDADAFIIRDAEIEADFASQQPGFIRRTSGVDADGKYAVIVFWETLEDADASIAAFSTDPTVADYFAMIDGNTFLAERYSIFETTPQIPNNLTIDDNGFFPEDITIINNWVFVSGLGDGTIRTFDLTETNASAQLFAAAETGYAQSWGLKSNGSVVLNLLNNVDFTFTTPPDASKLVQYDMNGTKTGEWDLPANTIGHTVSIVDGKYYVTDFGNPRIIEVDPTTSNVNDNWFTSPQWDPSVDGNVGGTIYDGSAGFYAYLGFQFWYIPINNGQAGTMQAVNISGLSGEQINADGITWGANQNTLYYSSNDTGDPADAGTVYKLEFSNTTTAT